MFSAYPMSDQPFSSIGEIAVQVYTGDGLKWILVATDCYEWEVPCHDNSWSVKLIDNEWEVPAHQSLWKLSKDANEWVLSCK